MDLSDGPTSFLKADEVDEAVQTGTAHLKLSQQQQQTYEQPQTDIASDTVDLQSNGALPSSRPPLVKDRWAPAPQQPPPPAPPIPQNGNPTDSLSLMQLRRLVAEMPKQESTPYAFTYEDSSVFEEEIEELFEYSKHERQALARIQDAFLDSWGRLCRHSETPWLTAEPAQQENFLMVTKEFLQSEAPGRKMIALDNMLYIALGCWHESASSEGSLKKVSPHVSGHRVQAKSRYRNYRRHIDAMKSGLDLLRKHIGVAQVYDIWKTVTSSEEDIAKYSRIERDALQWSSTCILYLFVDRAWRTRNQPDGSTFRDDILALQPSLLDTIVKHFVILRWNDQAEIPSSKMLMLLWKAILVIFGGTADVVKIKDAMAPDSKAATGAESRITASPLDYHVFRQELLSKYPAFNPPPTVFPLEPESTSMISPLQDHIRHADSRDPNSNGAGPASINGSGPSILHQPVHIATPAPSPPPSPAGPGKGVKKHNYQTNQMFPFLYPPLGEPAVDENGAQIAGGNQDAWNKKWAGKHIPTSIQEAADIFSTHVRTSRSMRQLWQERAEFLRCERQGLGPKRTSKHVSGEDSPAADQTFAASDKDKEHLTDSDKAVLDRVVSFYATNLKDLPSMTIVLLRVLLQTVTFLVTQPNGTANSQGSLRSNDTAPDARQDSFEPRSPTSMLGDLNQSRNYEIMSKSVSGILLLLLKWFKTSHILKFEYFSQLLLDSNYIQLLLKLLTHQELERIVNYRCERPSMDFFRFCQLHNRHGRMPNSESEDSADSEDAAPPAIRSKRDEDDTESQIASNPAQPAPEVDELGYSTTEHPQEPITKFSWRNFFSSINHLRVLQKIVKKKAHRQLLMVQFKYSVILKRALKVPQPDIRLYTLKIIKGQVPYCPRKWRSSNMRVITAIYLHCKPELRDEWLAGADVDQEMTDALPLEQALRSLTRWYNVRYFDEGGHAHGDDQQLSDTKEQEEQDFFVKELEKINLFVDGDLHGDGFDEEEPMHWS